MAIDVNKVYKKINIIKKFNYITDNLQWVKEEYGTYVRYTGEPSRNCKLLINLIKKEYYNNA